MSEHLHSYTPAILQFDDRTEASLCQRDTREHLVLVLQHIFFAALRDIRCADRPGFALTMYFESESLWHADRRIVGVPPPTCATDERLSYEKSIRLRGYPQHRTSTESRHPALRRFGGAIRVTGGIVGIHGLPEWDNELLALTGSLCVRLMTHREVSYALDASEVAQRATGEDVDPCVRGLVWGLLDTVYAS